MRPTITIFLALLALSGALSSHLNTAEFATKEKPWFNQPPPVYADAEDLVTLDLSYYVNLHNLKTVNSEKCSEGVNYLDWTNVETLTEKSYGNVHTSVKLENCGHFVKTKKENVFVGICNKTIATLVHFGATKEPEIRTLDIAKKVSQEEEFEPIEIHKCSDITSFIDMGVIFFACEHSGSEESGTIVVVAASIALQGGEFRLIQYIDNIQMKQKGEHTLGTDDLNIFGFHEGNGENYVLYVTPRDHKGSFKAHTFEFKSVKVSGNQAGNFIPGSHKFLTRGHEHVSGFPEKILGFDTDSELAYVAFLEGKTAVHAKVCNFADNKKIYCGEGFKIFDISEEQVFDIDFMRKYNSPFIEVAIYNNEYFEINRQVIESKDLKMAHVINGNFKHVFKQKLGFEKPQGIFRHNERVFIYGTNEHHVTKVSSVWMKSHNQMDLTLDNYKHKGDLFISEHQHIPNTYEFFYFSQALFEYNQVSSPSISFGSPDVVTKTKFKRGRAEGHVCDIFAEYHDGSKHKMEIEYSILMDTRDEMHVSLHKKYQEFKGSDFVVPISRENWSGNAPHFSHSVNGDIKKSEDGSHTSSKYIHWTNIVDVEMKTVEGKKPITIGDITKEVTPRTKTAHLREPKAQSSQWIAGNLYIIDTTHTYKVQQCSHDNVREVVKVKCEDLIEISKMTHGTKYGMKLLSADVGDRMMYIFFGYHDPQDKKDKTVLYPINMDHLTQHDPHTFEHHFDKMDLQYSQGQMIGFGISKRKQHSDHDWNVSVIQFSTLSDAFKSSDIKFMEVQKDGDRERICPYDIELLPATIGGLLIRSKCHKDLYASEDSATWIERAYVMTFDRRDPTFLVRKDSFDLSTFSKPEMCATDRHVHIIDTDTTESVKVNVISFALSDEKTSQYTYHISSYHDIKKYVGITCDMHKDMVHVLAENSDQSKKYVASLFGNPENNPNKRIHSITEVDKDTEILVAGYNSDLPVTIVLYGNKKHTNAEKALVEQLSSPRVYVNTEDCPDAVMEFPLHVVIAASDKTDDKINTTATIEMVEFNTDMKLEPHGNKAGIKPKDGKDKAIIHLEDVLEMEGLIDQIHYKGSEHEKNFMSEKMTHTSGHLIETEDEIIGMKSELDKYTLAWTKNHIGYYDSDGQLLTNILIAGKMEAADIVTVKGFKQPIAVFITKHEGASHLYVIHPDHKNHDEWVYSRTTHNVAERLEDIKVVTSFGDHEKIFGVVGYTNFQNSALVFMAFKLSFDEKDNKSVEQIGSTKRTLFYEEDIHGFSSVQIDDYLITTVLLDGEKEVYFSLDSFIIDDEVNFVLEEVANERYSITKASAGLRDFEVDNNGAEISCEKGSNIESKKVTAENPSIRCFIATAGVYSLFADIALENFLTIKQTLNSKIINPELTLVTDLGLNVPDFTPARTIYRHPYAVTVLVRDNSKKVEVKEIDENKKEPLNERILIAIHKSNGQLVPMAQALINGSDLGYKHAHEVDNIHPTLSSTSQSATVRVNSKGKRVEKYVVSDFVFNIGDYSKMNIDTDKFELTSMIKPHDQKTEIPLSHVFSNGHHVHTHEDHGHLRKHTHEDEKVVEPEHHHEDEHHDEDHGDHKVPDGERPGPMNFNRDEYDREKNEERRIRNEHSREKKEGEREAAEGKRESLYQKLIRLKKELEELREKFSHEEKLRQEHEKERRRKWHTQVKEEPKKPEEHENHDEPKDEHHDEPKDEHHDEHEHKDEDKKEETENKEEVEKSGTHTSSSGSSTTTESANSTGNLSKLWNKVKSIWWIIMLVLFLIIVLVGAAAAYFFINAKNAGDNYGQHDGLDNSLEDTEQKEDFNRL